MKLVKIFSSKVYSNIFHELCIWCSYASTGCKLTSLLIRTLSDFALRESCCEEFMVENLVRACCLSFSMRSFPSLFCVVIDSRQVENRLFSEKGRRILSQIQFLKLIVKAMKKGFDRVAVSRTMPSPLSFFVSTFSLFWCLSAIVSLFIFACCRLWTFHHHWKSNNVKLSCSGFLRLHQMRMFYSKIDLFFSLQNGETMMVGRLVSRP